MKKITKTYKVKNNVEVVIEEVFSARYDENEFYVYGRMKVFFWWEQITLRKCEYNEKEALETAKRMKKQLLRLV